MCCVMLITLVLSNSGHYKPQWAHVLSCVNSAQRCVAQCRRATGLSRHTMLRHPVSVCAICKTKGHSFSNEACARQLPQCTVVFVWCKRFKDGRSSTEELAHSRLPPHITNPDTHAKVHRMVQCDRAMLHHISEHPGSSVEHVHYITMHILV